MEYVFYSEQHGKQFTRPVSTESELYLNRFILLMMSPLSDDDYILGPLKLFGSLSKYIYILDNENVYWCISETPGLVLVKFSPNSFLEQATAPSPNPEYGGRKATEFEVQKYQEIDVNPQQFLIYDAWNEQFEKPLQEDWKPLSEDGKVRFKAAIRHASDLASNLVR